MYRSQGSAKIKTPGRTVILCEKSIRQVFEGVVYVVTDPRSLNHLMDSSSGGLGSQERGVIMCRYRSRDQHANASFSFK